MSSCRATCHTATLQPVTQKSFSLQHGDSPTLRFTVVQPDDSPFNLSDYAVNFFIKRSLQDSDAGAEFQGTIGDGVELGGSIEDGLLDVTIPATVTLALLYHRPYPWFLRLNHTIMLERISVPAQGTFLLQLPAT